MGCHVLTARERCSMAVTDTPSRNTSKFRHGIRVTWMFTWPVLVEVERFECWGLNVDRLALASQPNLWFPLRDKDTMKIVLYLEFFPKASDSRSRDVPFRYLWFDISLLFWLDSLICMSITICDWFRWVLYYFNDLFDGCKLDWPSTQSQWWVSDWLRDVHQEREVDRTQIYTDSSRSPPTLNCIWQKHSTII